MWLEEGFLIVALNNLKILAGGIQNAYLNARTKEKKHFYSGDEWKSNKSKAIIISRALYGLKSSALVWLNHLADILGNKLKFKSSLSDPDLWYKEMVSTDGFEYDTFILVHIDDILILDKKSWTIYANFKRRIYGETREYRRVLIIYRGRHK